MSYFDFFVIFLGILFGFLNGYFSTFILKKYINDSNKKFFKIYVILFIYRIFFLLSFFILLWFLLKKVIIILLSCFLLIFMNVFIEIISFKNHGIKRRN